MTMIDKLTFRERLACSVLSHLKYDMKTNEFIKCHKNDIILTLGGWILKGRDPIEFIAWVLDLEVDDPYLATLR